MSNESPAAILYDATGNPIRVLVDGSNRYVGTGMIQDVKAVAGNTSTANIGSGASFTGTATNTLGVAGVQVSIFADQPMLVEVQQSTDGANWDVSDSYDTQPDFGDGRTIQAVAEWVRVIVTNLGPQATTEFRLSTFLCPTVEAVPRALTPRGALRLSKSTTSFYPDNHNFSLYGELPALSQDVRGNLCTRGSVLTDEESFRTDYPGTTIYQNLTGTSFFRNGSTHVVGQGTNFTSEVAIRQYMKLTADPDADAVLIQDVFSDTHLILAEPYGGTTGSGVGQVSDWSYVIDAGGSISVGSSEMAIESGTTDGSVISAVRIGDYPPYVVGFRAKIDQRVANQIAHLGMTDGFGGVDRKQALIIFDGTDATKVKLRTGADTGSVEETTATLPFGGVTSTYHQYMMEIVLQYVVLWVDGVKVAENRLHVPGPYDTMNFHTCIRNVGVPISSTTLTLDSSWFNNINELSIVHQPESAPQLMVDAPAPVSVSTSVAAAVADTQLLAANPDRIGATIFNDSTADMYLKLGTGASATSYTVKLPEDGYYEVPYRYVGAVHGYWSGAVGAARVTEVS